MLQMVKFHQVLASDQLLYLIVTSFCLFLEHRCEHSSTYVRISERLSKSVCHYTESFASTKEIQPALDDHKKFPQFATCKILRWTVKAYPDCNTFERISDNPPCNTTEPKLIKKQDGGRRRVVPGPKGKNSNTRIVGGTDAEINEFPYMASVIKFFAGGSELCGGIIYDSMFVLTASHCVGQNGRQRIIKFIVTVGDHNINEVDATEQVLEVEQIIMHERFNNNTLENDIALIKLAKPIKFTKGVGPILMPKSNQKPCGQVIATGWGQLNHTSDETPDILQKVTISIVPLETCKKAYRKEKEELDDTNTCAGLFGHGGKDACFGDSGGPLAKKLPNGSYVLIGITSWAIDCGLPDLPGIYTDVAQYVDWIHSKVTKKS